jgi:hypothetical protein
MRSTRVAACICAICLAASQLALAQTGPALLIKPLMDEKEVWESHGDAFLQLDDGSTSNGGDSFRMNVFEDQGRVREQREKFIPRLGWDLAYYDIHSDDPALKKSLTDVSIAAGVELGTYFDWRAGLTLGLGYAGDTPFAQSDAWYGKGTLVVGRSFDKMTDAAFVLDYDGNRSVFPDIPLPGFEYRHQYDPTLTYVVGFPVNDLIWKPNDVISVDVAWTFLDTFDARLEYKLAPKWTAFGNYLNRRDAFHSDTLHGVDRLLFQQHRAELGIKWQPWEHTSLLVAGGYSFGGEFSSGFDQSRSDLIADISDEPYVRIGFERRF